MQAETYPEPIIDALERFAGTDVVVKEQYLDFIKGRRFRQTLLCRDEVLLDRGLGPERITELYVASLARPVSANPDLREGAAELFRGPRGAALETATCSDTAPISRVKSILTRWLASRVIPLSTIRLNPGASAEIE